MSSTAIDQLFPITSAPQSVSNSARTDRADGESFSSLLSQAEKANAPEPSETKNHVESESLDENDTGETPIEANSDEQETSTAEQEETTGAQESKPTEEEADENPSDEVTLSAAATTQETADPQQVVPNLEQLAATGDQEPQSEEQPASQAEAGVEKAVATEAGLEFPATAAVQAETGETASVEEAAGARAQNAVDGKHTSSNPETAVLASKAGEASQPKEPLPGTKTTQLAEQPAIAPATAEETEKTPRTSSRISTSRFQQAPVAVTSVVETSDIHTPLDAEIAASLNTTSDTAANSPGAPGSTSAGEVGAVAGRTLGAASTSATHDAAPTETPTVDRARFVQRVGGAIRSAQQRDGQIQLRLSPPELGTLRIQIEVKEGVVTARLETETNAARTVLLDNLPALRERLAEQQIRIEKFDVDVGRDGQQSADNPEPGDRQQDDTSRRENKSTAPGTTAPLTTAEPLDLTPSATASGLDVRI